MSIFTRLKEWLTMKFLGVAKQQFNVKPLSSEEMDVLINQCANIYAGVPYWLDAKEHITTINFAKSLCSEVARLTTLGVEIKVDGSARADYLQAQTDAIKALLRKWVEYAAVYGTIILKPNGTSIDLVTPQHFTITSCENGSITGIVFQETIRASDGKHFYHRLEYHNRKDGKYTITNRCFISEADGDIGSSINIDETPWRGLTEEVNVDNAEQNLFGALFMPHANNVDIDSPLGMPIISDCIEELKDLDIAYSRNALEIKQSKRTVLIDSDRMMAGNKATKSTAGIEMRKEQMGLPDMVRVIEGDGNGMLYQEINPSLNTGERLIGINALLSQIGYKVGFSNGHFVFNESVGIQTATGVEASQQRTIQFIKDVRDQLQACMGQLIYALNAFADAYDLAPLGDYEVAYNFADITYNVEEDRARWWSYVMSNKVPAWKFFVKFEGMTEEEAKEMVQEAMPVETQLFPGIE